MGKYEKKDTHGNNWGYGSVTYEDCWNLNTRLARIISEHLHAFLNAEKFSPNGGSPLHLLNDCDGNGIKATNLWLNIIRKMIYSFDNYRLDKRNYQQENIDEEKVREGMRLFVKYFDDLWM